MLLSYHILLDVLEEYSAEEHLAEDAPKSFAGVSIFPAREKPMSSELLYVGRLSELLAAQWRDGSICCVAVRDRLQDSLETDERLKNLILLNCNCEITDVFEHLQNTFLKITKWYMDMDEYIIRNRPIQDILRLSEDVIGNYITISDSSLALMAYTAGLSCDCPFSNNLVANGYHDDRAVAILRENHLLEEWKRRSDIYCDNTHRLSPYSYICKVIHYNNFYFAHVVMLCDNRPYSRGLEELFRILLYHLENSFERMWRDRSRMAHVYDGLLISLLEEDAISPEIFGERVQHSGLPAAADFRFAKISAAAEMNVMLQRLGQDILSSVPESRVTLYGETLAVLLIQHEETAERTRRIFDSLGRLTARYGARCGVSNTFGELSGLKLADKQADIALRFGGTQAPYPLNAEMSGAGDVFFFEDSYPRYLLAGNADNGALLKNTRAFLALELLRSYDLKHDSNNFELLYVYLNCERRATDTAAILHMHRNNVIYRVGRISEMIDMNLDNSRDRFRLLLAYERFSATEKDNKSES